MLSGLKTWAANHPRLAAWIALAIGMVVVLVIAARDVGLLWNQWLFLIVATIGLAGLCVWIIGWEAGDEGQDEGDGDRKENTAATGAADGSPPKA